MNNKQKAILLMVVSTFSFSLMQLIVKISGDAIPTMEQVFVRNFLTLCVGFFWAIRAGTPLWGKRDNRLLLLLRSLLGFIGVAGYFYATSNMNVADASMLHRSSPFFTILFAAVFLKNKLTKTQIGALLLAFIGALFVIRPNFHADALPALIGLLSAAAAGGAYVVINTLKGREHNATIIFFFSFFSCGLSFLLDYKNFIFPDKTQAILLMGIGAFASIGQIALTQAYKMANPGEVSIINYLGIVFSSVLGFAFLNEMIGIKSYLGMVLIFGAALLSYLHRDKKVSTPGKEH